MVKDHDLALFEGIDSDWQHVWDRDERPRPLAGHDAAGVVELTGLLRPEPGNRDRDQLANWPADMRIICRRKRPHPGAQLSLFEEADGWRYQVFVTNTPRGQLDFLEARHRAHARVEDRVRCGKATGLEHLPSRLLKINNAWCLAAGLANDLLAWTQLLCLNGDLATAEPQTLRYRILHTAARVVRGQRKRKIKIPETWPWATRSRAPSTPPSP